MPKYTNSYSSKRTPHYRKSARNSLSTLSGSRRRQAHRKRGATYLHHSQGFGHGNRGYRGGRQRERRNYALIVIGAAFLVFLASILWYVNRSVDITLNGETVSVRINSSIQQLIDDQALDVEPGRLLAVDDSVLDDDGGEPYLVKLAGKKVAIADLSDTKLQGGEKLKISDGEDVYEEHQVQATAIQPTITIEGDGAIQYVSTWGVAGRSEVWTGEVSGKTQDRGVVKEAQNCVVSARNVTPDSKKKQYIALTFDEGPSQNTQAILDMLEKKGVKATFFLQGDAIAGNEEAVAAIASAGHEIGSNAFSDTDLSALSGEDLRSQLSQGFEAIASAGGGTTALLRAPYTSFSLENWAESMDVVSAVVSWNLDSGDWLLPGAQGVVDTVVGSAVNGNIVLLTDNDATSEQTVEALGDIIDGLQSQGFTLVTLSKLISTDKDLAEELTSPDAVNMPKSASLPTVAEDTEE